MRKQPVTYQLDPKLIAKIKKVAAQESKPAQVLVSEILTKKLM